MNDLNLELLLFYFDNVDVDLFNALVEKTDFLFDFVRNNVLRRIEKAVNKSNYLNIIKFFDVYSSYYDDLFASILAKYANEDLTDKIFEMLEKGNVSQKTYAAKYFLYIPDTIALETLNNLSFSDDESLSYNSAEALGQMNDEFSYNKALELLNSDDDFEQLKAVKFFVAYGKNYPLEKIFETLKKSKMPENIAGQIPYMVSLCEILCGETILNALVVIDNILSGLGEILPLSDIFQFEMQEVLDILVKKNSNENQYSGKIAQVLLKALCKFNLFVENQEYIFDEDKDTKQEITSIQKMIVSLDEVFWNKQKNFVLKELESTEDRVLSALPVLSELKMFEAIDSIKLLLNRNSEIILCETLSTLKELNALENIDIEAVVSKIDNPNIKAFVENLKA